jgi:hypothetical protein
MQEANLTIESLRGYVDSHPEFSVNKRLFDPQSP